MVDQSSRSHTCISRSFVVVVVAICRVLCFLGIKESKCSSRPPRVLYGSSDERKAKKTEREGLKREKSGKSISRKYLIRGSLFDSFAISRSVRRSIVGSQVRSVSAHSLFLRARVRSLQDERKRR